MQATLNIWNANTINEVDSVLNVPRTKIAEALGIPVRNITDKMLGLSDTSENVLRLLQITQIQHTYVVSSEKYKKMYVTFQSYPFKRFSSLNKSYFLGF
jgi:hypothetical protein